ncbi:unnamed protein product [Pleuronectes platessa]|uniref:Secreted protein n=1 Tax=Pleuronectes platessa TaxID=8262 RepID=A0A9N7YE40_PLEPL|nr:unnamed protein product [Pleuronectes platessa]
MGTAAMSIKLCVSLLAYNLLELCRAWYSDTLAPRVNTRCQDCAPASHLAEVPSNTPGRLTVKQREKVREDGESPSHFLGTICSAGVLRDDEASELRRRPALFPRTYPTLRAQTTSVHTRVLTLRRLHEVSSPGALLPPSPCKSCRSCTSPDQLLQLYTRSAAD